MGNQQAGLADAAFADCKDYQAGGVKEDDVKIDMKGDDDSKKGGDEEGDTKEAALDPYQIAKKLRTLAKNKETSVKTITALVSSTEFNADFTLKKLVNSQEVAPPKDETKEAKEAPAEEKSADARVNPVCKTFYSGDTVAHIAAENGDIELLQYLFTCEADLRIRNKLGSTPLHRAVAMDQIKATDFLLKNGVDGVIHEQNNIGNTPLHIAAFCGSLDMCKFLLENGAEADILINNSLKASALDLARAIPVQNLLTHYTTQGAAPSESKDAKQ